MSVYRCLACGAEVPATRVERKVWTTRSRDDADRHGGAVARATVVPLMVMCNHDGNEMRRVPALGDG